MAQFNSDSYEGASNLPTNSHGGMVMAHRSVVSFPKETALANNDIIVLGVLAPGYTIDRIVADTEAVVGLKVALLKAESLDDLDAATTVATEVDLATAGQVQAVLTSAAIKDRGADVPLFLIAKVTSAGTLAANKEIGVRFEYRYRQAAY